MEMNFDEDEEQGGLLERVKESPRTVSALIIILIIAAAIYAFSGNEEQPEITEAGDQVTITEEDVVEDDADDTEDAEDVSADIVAGEGDTAGAMTEDATKTVDAPEPVEEKALEEQAQALPEPKTSDNGYTEVAEAGDGVTHLARRAATRWLVTNQAGYEVTNEHRIYMEDYIKDQLGSHGLNPGDSVDISFDMIQQAADAAGNLSPAQLANLSQYTSVLQ